AVNGIDHALLGVYGAVGHHEGYVRDQLGGVGIGRLFGRILIAVFLAEVEEVRFTHRKVDVHFADFRELRQRVALADEVTYTTGDTADKAAYRSFDGGEFKVDAGTGYGSRSLI